jgi:hypothetical protein
MDHVSEPAGGLPTEDNPAQAADAGNEGTGSFIDGLSNESGSDHEPALQDVVPGGESKQDKSGATATSDLPGFATALPKESRADPKVVQFLSKFKSWDELTKAAIELESKLGKAGTMPKDVTPEDGGKPPEKPEDYDLGDLGDNQYVLDKATQVKAIAHKMGLSQEKAKGLWEDVKGSLVELFTTAADRNRTESPKLEEKLKAEWGNNYATNRNIMARGKALFGDDFIGELREAGLMSSYSVAKQMYRLGLLLGEDKALDKSLTKTEFVPGIDRPGL